MDAFQATGKCPKKGKGPPKTFKTPENVEQVCPFRPVCDNDSTSANLSSFRDLGTRFTRPPWHCRIKIYNQRIWLSLVYLGYPTPLGVCPKHPMDKLALDPLILLTCSLRKGY
ncbi:hypothetical protein TNCV_4998811 [Trichonephila clavipes]|nr:hypothetical protein TNCV_4998811 [Trichonephila clavipes]